MGCKTVLSLYRAQGAVPGCPAVGDRAGVQIPFLRPSTRSPAVATGRGQAEATSTQVWPTKGTFLRYPFLGELQGWLSNPGAEPKRSVHLSAAHHGNPAVGVQPASVPTSHSPAFHCPAQETHQSQSPLSPPWALWSLRRAAQANFSIWKVR